MKTVTVAGTTNLNGVTKFRTANDLAFRTKQFIRAGQTEINLIELPEAMDKITAARYCLTHEKFAELKCQIAINEALGEENAPAIIAQTINDAPEAPVTTEETEERSTTHAEIKELMPVLEADDDYGDLLEMAGYNGDNDAYASDDY